MSGNVSIPRLPIHTLLDQTGRKIKFKAEMNRKKMEVDEIFFPGHQDRRVTAGSLVCFRAGGEPGMSLSDFKGLCRVDLMPFVRPFFVSGMLRHA